MSGILIFVALVIGLAVGILLWIRREGEEPSEPSEVRPEPPSKDPGSKHPSGEQRPSPPPDGSDRSGRPDRSDPA